MGNPLVKQIYAREGESPKLMSRCLDATRVAVVASQITAIELTVYNSTAGEAVVVSPSTLSKAAVWFDTLQTTADWTSTEDATGYNFAYALPSAYLACTEDSTFRVEVYVTVNAGEDFYAMFADVDVTKSRGR
jgi:hypothetical protein